MSRRRRNPLVGRQPVFVGGIAVVSGLLAATAGLRPTGSSPVDWLLVAVAAGAVTWAAATAPWWLLAGTALVAAGTAPSAPLVVLASAALVLACVIGAQRRNLPWARAVSVLVVIQVMARCELDVFLGASALVSCAPLAVVFVWGVLRRPRAVRRRVWQVVGGVGASSVAMVLAFAVAAASARSQLEEGNRQARAGLAALNRGDTASAAEAFAASARSFGEADDALSAFWAQGARLVPVVAQHRNSVAGLSTSAAAAMRTAANAVQQVDPDRLRMVNGRIDVDAVAELEVPFSELARAIDDLQAAVGDAGSVWLAEPLQRRLDDLAGELAGNRTRADNALLAVQVAPEMLGSEGPRRYFIAFTTPAEIRGLGGFMGNWAEVTIDAGQVTLSGFGRHSDLSEAGGANRRLTGLEAFTDHWGRFGFDNAADGTTGPVVWSNITVAPDFPMVAEVIAQLYPQSGGLPLDGVFMLDPQAMAALMTFTGPVEVEGVGQALTPQNVVQYIVKDQYLLPDNDQRIDVLDAIARSTMDQLLAGSLPPPAELGNTFAPLAADGSLMAWSAHEVEQQLLVQVKMDGGFPVLDGGDGVAVTLDNGGGNKIDAYLDLAVEHVVTAESADGGRSSTVTVTLTNTAPASGLPRYVIGNSVGLPDGTNRTWLSVYTALPMVSVLVDGQPAGMETGTVLGWNVATRFVEVPPGATVTVQLTLDGSLSDPSAPLISRVPPLYIEPSFTSSATTAGPR